MCVCHILNKYNTIQVTAVAGHHAAGVTSSCDPAAAANGITQQ